MRDFAKAAFHMGRGHFGRHRHRGGPDFAWGPFPGERRTRRGDVKFAILETLLERPRHGYDVIRALEEQREGYRPSPGSVYPTLQMLEDEGYVTSETVEGKRVYTLTAEGREFLATRPGETEGVDGSEQMHDLRHELRDAAFRLGAAIWQVAREGDPVAGAKVREIVDRARRDIYTILGEASR
jgi:DNA-binding PadR family transcriptional regulator